MVVDKHQKKAVVIDAAIPKDCIIGKNKHKEVEKYQGLIKEKKKLWKVSIMSVVTGSLGAVTPKVEVHMD